MAGLAQEAGESLGECWPLMLGSPPAIANAESRGMRSVGRILQLPITPTSGFLAEECTAGSRCEGCAVNLFISDRSCILHRAMPLGGGIKPHDGQHGRIAGRRMPDSSCGWRKLRALNDRRLLTAASIRGSRLLRRHKANAGETLAGRRESSVSIAETGCTAARALSSMWPPREGLVLPTPASILKF